MPVIEAMACGLPVIATDWSAHRDFMNEQNAYPLPIEGLVSAKAKCPYYTGFRWAQPSILPSSPFVASRVLQPSRSQGQRRKGVR